MAVNKVVYNGSTLIDLESDTATASDVRQGKTFHTAAGLLAVGTLIDGGGDMASGEVVISSASSSNKNITITTLDEIGFTPKAFLIVADTYQTTRYYTQWSAAIDFDGSHFSRLTVDRGNGADASQRDEKSWTVTPDSNGFLYLVGDTICFRNSSSHRLGKTTYKWYAIDW